MFLITLKSLNTNVDGIKFYQAPQLTCGLPAWVSSASNLPLLGALEQRFVGTEGALPVNHTLTISQ